MSDAERKPEPMSDTQRLAEIERKIDRLALLLESHQERFEEQAETSQCWRRKIVRALHGDDGGSGLMVRVDRLEQTGERARWITRAFGGSALAALIGAIVALFKS